MLDKMVDLEKAVMHENISYWKHEVLWSPLWWFGIVCILLSLYLLYKFLDRSRIIEISVCGLACLMMASSIDGIGIAVPLWSYPYPTTPFFEPLFAVDFFLFPTPNMLLYQKFPKWKPYLIGTMLLSLLFSFGFEPFAKWIHIYVLVNWKYYYSVPLYTLIFITSKWIADRSQAAHSKAEQV